MSTLTASLNGFRSVSLLSHWVRSLTRAGSQDSLSESARADHRVVADCQQASCRDLDDESGLARSWGRFPECLPDGRGNATHLRHT